MLPPAYGSRHPPSLAVPKGTSAPTLAPFLSRYRSLSLGRWEGLLRV
jgi:hypothetical protein